MARRPTGRRRPRPKTRRSGPQNSCGSCGYQWHAGKHVQAGICPNCGASKGSISAVWLQVGLASLVLVVIAIIFFAHRSSNKAEQARILEKRAEQREENARRAAERAEKARLEAIAPKQERPATTPSRKAGGNAADTSSEAEDEEPIDSYLEDANDKFGAAHSLMSEVEYLPPDRARKALKRCKAMFLQAKASLEKSSKKDTEEQKELSAVIDEFFKDCSQRLEALPK